MCVLGVVSAWLVAAVQLFLPHPLVGPFPLSPAFVGLGLDSFLWVSCMFFHCFHAHLALVFIGQGVCVCVCGKLVKI